MPGNFRKEDLRVQKTRKALLDALYDLINKGSFSKLSVYDICERALVSRSAFYVHYKDKYDLLEQLLSVRFTDLINSMSTLPPDERESRLARLIFDHKRYLRNLLDGADQEQLRILLNTLSNGTNPFIPDLSIDQDHPAHGIFAVFTGGGFFNMLRVFALDNTMDSDDIAEELRRASALFRHMYNLNQINPKGGSHNAMRRL